MPGSPLLGDEQVEALLLPHLADDDAAGPHPQRLLDQASQRDLAGALEVRLPGLHRDPVRQVEPQLEDLLAADHPLSGRHGGAQAVQQRQIGEEAYVNRRGKDKGLDTARCRRT